MSDPQLFLFEEIMATTTKIPEVKQKESTAKVVEQVESTADIHHMVMTLAATNNPDQLPGGAVTGDQADARLRTWLEQGFKLHSVERIQAGDVNGIFTLQVLYILVKE